MTIARVVAVFASFVLIGCKSEKPEPKAEMCPKDHFADPAGRFCVKLPAGYKILEEKNGPGWPSAILGSNEGAKVTIVLAPPDQFDSQISIMAKETNDGDKVTEQLDLPGRGKFMTVAMTAITMQRAKSVVKAPKNALICQGSWNDGEPPTAADICKTLLAPN